MQKLNAMQQQWMQNVLSLQPFYAITSTFSSEDQSQVEIKGKWREIK